MVARSNSNPNDFCLPDLGEGLEEAELIEWCVHVGQRVEENDTLAKMETAKALVEVPSPRGGTIAELHGKPGEAIKVGAPLVTYHAEPDAAAPRAAAPRRRRGGNGNRAKAAEPRPDSGTVVGSLGAGDDDGGKVRAVPAVRRLARDLGVDLEHVSGTGVGGRITLRRCRSGGRVIACRRRGGSDSRKRRRSPKRNRREFPPTIRTGQTHRKPPTRRAFPSAACGKRSPSICATASIMRSITPSWTKRMFRRWTNFAAG